MRRWTIEERLRQAELIKRWQPWKTAGVKTPRGKEVSKMNAYKHGARSTEMRNMTKLTTQFQKRLKNLRF